MQQEYHELNGQKITENPTEDEDDER